jgi:exonuclease SbcC
MKPLELTFNGLRSYATFGPISFADRSLVGILGDTGAGKSTILEGLCVALYGKCSWSERDVRDLIADGATAMSVDLTFLHDGQKWRVRRSYFTNTMPSTHLLENLDTGLKIDNARPVDETIVGMLRMDFSAFRSAVLLPQGRFATLLHATGRERTDLLRGIFGADTVETVRTFVNDRRTTLGDLLAEARQQRAAMLPDPATAATEALARATAYEQRAALLTASRDRIRAAQKITRDAVFRSTTIDHVNDELNSAASSLTATQVDAPLGAAATVATELDAAAQRADVEEQEHTARLQSADAALAAADAAGQGPTQLAAATATLDNLPRRIRDLGDESHRLEIEHQRISEERSNLDAIITALPAQTRLATRLASAAQALARRLDSARAATNDLRDKAHTVLDAAMALADTTQQHSRLASQLRSAEQALPELQNHEQTATDDLTDARRALAEAHRADAAAIAGAHLHADDPCPVCGRALADDYVAPKATDPDALTATQATETARVAAFNQAQTKRLGAEQDIERLRHEVSSAQERTQGADGALAAAVQCAAETAGADALTAPIAVADLPVEIELPNPADASAFTVALRTTIDSVTQANASDRTARATEVDQLLVWQTAYTAALHVAAEQARTAANTQAGSVQTAQADLQARETVYERETAANAAAQQRLASSHRRLAKDVGDLPEAVRAQLAPAPENDHGLAAWAETLGQQALKAAIAALQVALDRITSQEETRTTARKQLQEISGLRLSAAQRREAEVNDPVRRVIRRLEDAASALTDARQTLADLMDPPRAPASTDTSVAAAEAYATEVRKALSEAMAAGVVAAERAHGQATALLADLATDLDASLRDVGITAGSVAAATLPPDQIIDAAALEPITSAAAVASQQAAEARREESAAREQIEPASVLDGAIDAGQTRLVALDELKGLLADGKFLRYLTDRRTTALLGVASELFSRLSGGQFGFAAEFQVVARRTGVARSAKTLSGGETFLASLALALALVELYSRTGGRLGALFLDEGFGSLDVDTLAAALDVLRAESGGDKLVAVISHLHAVAEAVDAVLWVEKGPGGSAARWLDGPETEALIRDDAAAGLLALS